jgi:hypothetical protein
MLELTAEELYILLEKSGYVPDIHSPEFVPLIALSSYGTIWLTLADK